MIIFIRQLAVYVCVAILLVYAWKDWFKSLCGLILLTAVMGRLDFPQSFGGIQGLNVWNVLFTDIFLAWLMNRRRQGFVWDMPRNINVFLLLWLGVILVGWVRMMVDRSQLAHFTPLDLISEQLINTIKWPIVGLLLFDGCRTRHRIKLALACTLLLFALFTVQIVRYVPLMVVLEPGNLKARSNINEDIGINVNGAAKMMSGVPWAMLAIMPLLKMRKYKLFMLGACVTSLYAVALAGSRIGYIACTTTLVILCLLRWRRYLLLLPFAVLILYAALPGARARMLQGFGEIDVAGEEITNDYEVTAGRSEFWPYVISKIQESPVFGFGREAMVRTGLQETLEKELDVWDAVTHPHNAYLEILLDNGLIGFVIIIGLHMVIWVYSARLFVDRTDPLYTAAGGIALALLTGHLVSNMGGQYFYPDNIDLGLWCAIGVMLRLYVARIHLLAKADGTSAAAIYPTKDITVSQTPLVWAKS
ncbi:MAG TPA: O-antigen ligase family protein [Sedimentisphaerales bacterium]|nr:O-antigen ligase family protein [Sedimentisphaerales bacterium]